MGSNFFYYSAHNWEIFRKYLQLNKPEVIIFVQDNGLAQSYLQKLKWILPSNPDLVWKIHIIFNSGNMPPQNWQITPWMTWICDFNIAQYSTKNKNFPPSGIILQVCDLAHHLPGVELRFLYSDPQYDSLSPILKAWEIELLAFHTSIWDIDLVIITVHGLRVSDDASRLRALLRNRYEMMARKETPPSLTHFVRSLQKRHGRDVSHISVKFITNLDGNYIIK